MQTKDARRIARLVVELRARLAGESYHVVGNVLVNLASEMLEQGAREHDRPSHELLAEFTQHVRQAIEGRAKGPVAH